MTSNTYQYILFIGDLPVHVGENPNIQKITPTCYKYNTKEHIYYIHYFNDHTRITNLNMQIKNLKYLDMMIVHDDCGMDCYSWFKKIRGSFPAVLCHFIHPSIASPNVLNKIFRVLG